jgi:hypothetical protein
VRKSLIAVVALVVLAGAAVAAVPILEQHAAAQIKTAMELDGSTKVGTVEVGLFRRSIALGDLRFVGNGMKGSVKRTEATGLAWPLGELLRGRTPFAGWTWGDPLQADHVEVKDLAITDPLGEGRWSAQALAIDGLDLARFDGSNGGQFATTVLTARALAALEMRRLAATKVMTALPGTGDTIGTAHLTVEHYDRGRIETLSLEGNEATAKDAKTPLYKLDRITARKVDWSQPLAAMSAASGVPGASIGRIHADDFSVTGFGGEMFSNLGVSLKAITLQTEREGAQTSRSRLRVEGFVYSPPFSLPNAQARLALTGMGLTEVKLDLDCASSEDRQKSEFQFGPCKLLGAGLGEIETSGRIVHADPPFWRAVDNGDSAALGQSKAALGSAKLVLVDKSLLERGLKLLSVFGQKPVAETRRSLAKEIRDYQPPDVMISQDLTRFLDTVARFVEQGGTLTVEAKPDPPVELGELQSLGRPGADVVGALGLTATVTR